MQHLPVQGVISGGAAAYGDFPVILTESVIASPTSTNNHANLGPAPAGIEIGDLLVIVLESSSRQPYPTNAGWANITSVHNSTRPSCACWYKIATSTEVADGRVTIELAGGSAWVDVFYYRVQNFDAAQPMEVSGFAVSTGGAVSAHSANSITTTVANTLAIASWKSQSNGAWTLTTPNGYTEINGELHHGATSVASKETVAIGATGAVVNTIAPVDYAAVQHFAIRPAT